MDHEGRIEKLSRRLGEIEVDALYVTNLTNVRYLTGFSGTNGQVLVTPDGATFLSDTRYAARAAQIVRGAEISIYKESRMNELLPGLLADKEVKALGVEGASMTLAERDHLTTVVPDIELRVTKGLIEDIRRVKEPAEVELIRRAVRIGDAAFAWVLDRLAPGVAERDVALDLEMYMRREGADDVAFASIVGSGELSAHIHHSPGPRTFDKGDLIIMDFGCKVDGYCSDLTRTVVIGNATDEQRDRYDLVLRSNRHGIDAARAGITAPDLDRAARTVIEDAGEGPAFAHPLGHGVGLDIHEAPRLISSSEEILRAGEVVTIEPGVYHEAWGGIRIEDCIHVIEDGCEVLSTAPKEDLIEL